jgi:TPR repeat protein
MGNCYYHGTGVAIDHRAAIGWYRLAAEQGHAIAQCSLGTCYKTSKGVAEDQKEAIRWYRSAAEQGVAEVEAGARILFLYPFIIYSFYIFN